jgi:esterase/lipase superfamily enzyme
MKMRAIGAAQRRRLFSLALAAAFSVSLSGCLTTGLDTVTSSVRTTFSAPEGEPQPVLMFVASTRKGEKDSTEAVTDGRARFSFQMISVPPGHEAGQVERPAFGSADPYKHFVASSRRSLDDEGMQAEIASNISGRIGSNRDILVYVHGFNTSYDEARFRLAQIVVDGRYGGVPVLFTWPSRAQLLAYGADKESATYSRDALERLLTTLAATPGIGRVHILAHSMGTWLTMEALRELAIGGQPDLRGRLGDVMLAAPDIDLDVFKQQLARLDPNHFTVFVSSGDRALSVSRSLAGDRQRLGAMNPSDPKERGELDKLGVKVKDLSNLSVGIIGHGTYADAPQVVRSIGETFAAPRAQDAQVQAVIDARGPDDPLPAPPPAAPTATAGATTTPR